MAPVVRLAVEVGVSPPTAKTWLDSLRAEQVYVGVQANLNAHKLGLKVDDFLIETSSHSALARIEKFCEEHPYTLYRARAYGGSTQGIFMQFRQPPGARAHLEQALRVMKEQGLAETIREIPTLHPRHDSVYTRPRLEAWDSERMVWTFDWNAWWEDSPSAAKTRKAKKVVITNDVMSLDRFDAKILEIITKDARQKNTEIIEKMGLDKREMGVQQMISKKLKRVKEAVKSYRAFINWTHFDVYNTPMVIAEASSEVTQRLISHLKDSAFPFGSSIRETPTGFVWYARMPSAHLSELVTLVWQIASSFETLTLDYKYSQRYGLWAETLDEDTRSWRIDEEFCLNAPMQPIGLM